jgi:hypothetical protein
LASGEVLQGFEMLCRYLIIQGGFDLQISDSCRK